MAWSLGSSTTTTASGGTLTESNLAKLYNELLQPFKKKHLHDGEIKDTQAYQNYLRGFKDFEFFKGGSDAGWEKVYKMVAEWKDLAFKKGIIKEDLPVERVGMSPLNFPSYKPTGGFTEGSTWDEGANDIIEKAAIEASRGEKGIATIEGDILKEGAMILGEVSNVGGKNKRLAVYYPSREEVVMRKLVGEVKKQRGEEVILGSGTYAPVSFSLSASRSMSASPSVSPSPSPEII